MAIIFDLDDTLYPEIDFVKSGFNAVAMYLQKKYHLDKNDLVSQMIEILKKDGRGKIFDKLLKNAGLYTEDRVQLLVYIYRSHLPEIKLYSDVILVLKRLKGRGMRLGIITDGMASVQRSKISALNIQSLFDVIMCTDELGKEFWKPSPAAFRLALDLLQADPAEAVYIGDNIAKDFIAPNSLGMLTIQINRNGAAGLISENVPFANKAKFIVKEFNEILPIVLKGDR